MENFCNVAFKEWAVVCHALATGRQSIIVRKGGIHEASGGFQVAHRLFWLYPTRFHQEPDNLRSGDMRLLAESEAIEPEAGKISLAHLARVEKVIKFEDQHRLASVVSQQVLADSVIEQRFHYREPGLFVLVVRIFAVPTPHVIVETPGFAGCKSWVELDEGNFKAGLSTADARPVLSDEQFAKAAAALAASI